MDYGMIGKIEKAKRYAQEHDRFRFQNFAVKFHGDNNDHMVGYQDGTWTCDCDYFEHHNVCSHTMALEQLLSGMLPPTE